jgi:hypothetical protein
MLLPALILLSTISFALPAQKIRNPQLLQAPVLALSPEERLRSSEEQVELAYGRAANLCTYLKIPSGEFSERRTDSVTISLNRPDSPVTHLAMTSSGEWKLLKATFPSSAHSAVYSEVTCVGLP